MWSAMGSSRDLLSFSLMTCIYYYVKSIRRYFLYHSTEVWSRITGYYRPVSNWNEGKAQEWEERNTYNIGETRVKKSPKKEVVKEEVKTKVEKTMNNDFEEGKRYLFVTKTCPQCKIIKKILEEHHIAYELMLADDHMDLARKYRIMTAPTMIVKENNEIKKYNMVPEIKAYIESL